MAELQRVWNKHQPDLNAMDKTSRAWLVAMKDWYKSMIRGGEIDAYLSKRSAASEKAKQVRIPTGEDHRRVVR